MIAYAFFHEKNRFEPVKLIFVSFSEFHPCLSSNPWFGLWGSLVWNMVIFKMALNHLKLFKNDRVCLFSWKKSFWASQTHSCKFSEFHPCLSPNPWFGVWESLVWNMVTCQNGFKSLETLRKWSCSRLLSWKKSFWASQTHFWKFSEFHPCLSPNPWFGLWGSLVWNMVTCQNGLKSLETLQKWSCMPSFMKKIVLSHSNSFLEVFRISPLSKSQSMIWFVGKSGVKYGNLSKWLEITWNFAKMIAYAFFHEKYRFEQFKLIFVSFQNFTLV